MVRITFKMMLVLFIAATVIAFIPSASQAEFHIILDEHFNRDPEQETWPWRTPGGYGWYHNVYNWPPPLVGPNSVCGWGWQDLIYNSHVLREEEFPGSIWCGYRTSRGPNDPQWPDVDRYWPNMNGWAIWGPFSLRYAIEGSRVAYWYRIDLRFEAGDSLSVVVVNNPGNLILNDAAFRSRCGIGKSYAAPTDGWIRDEVHFDSLYVNRELTSYLGERQCYLAFVWQSDAHDSCGPGAFVDDVLLGWDDGLFDLKPISAVIGYPSEDGDSIDWSRRTPVEGDEVYFKLNWKLVGAEGWTPPFDIEFKIDNEVLFTQHFDSLDANDTLLHTTVTDETWLALRGQHTTMWELDVPAEDEGNVEESNEDNNVLENLLEVIWDPPAIFAINTPPEGENEIMMDVAYEVNWTVSDSDEAEELFEVNLFWTTDTSGWAEDHEVVFNDTVWYDVWFGVCERGEHWINFTWTDAMVEVGDHIYIAGFAVDANPNHTTWAISPGHGIMIFNSVRDTPSSEVVGYELVNAYPNPFNRSLTIEYTLPLAERAKLTAYDLSGRSVATLVNGLIPAGRQTCVWQPSAIPGGIYLLRLETSNVVLQRKVVYMP